MSEMKLVQILCDYGETCDAHETVGIWANANVAREVAAQHGWTRREDVGVTLDFCAEHGGTR